MRLGSRTGIRCVFQASAQSRQSLARTAPGTIAARNRAATLNDATASQCDCSSPRPWRQSSCRTTFANEPPPGTKSTSSKSFSTSQDPSREPRSSRSNRLPPTLTTTLARIRSGLTTHLLREKSGDRECACCLRDYRPEHFRQRDLLQMRYAPERPLGQEFAGPGQD